MYLSWIRCKEIFKTRAGECRRRVGAGLEPQAQLGAQGRLDVLGLGLKRFALGLEVGMLQRTLQLVPGHRSPSLSRVVIIFVAWHRRIGAEDDGFGDGV